MRKLAEKTAWCWGGSAPGPADDVVERADDALHSWLNPEVDAERAMVATSAEAKRAKTKSASPRSCTVPHTPLCHGVSSLRLGIL